MTPKKKTTAAERARAEKAAPAFRLTARDLLHMFRERWIIGLVAGIIAAAALILFQPEEEPVYQTQVSLLFQRKDRVLSVQGVVDDTQSATEMNVHTEKLRSKTFLETLLASFTPDETKRIQEAYRNPEAPDEPLPSLAQIIGRNFSITSRRGATILVISVTNRSPEAAALIANRIANRYIAYHLDSTDSRTNSAIVLLRTQADQMRAEVEQAQNAMQAYRAKNNIAALGENQNVVRQKVAALNSAMVRAQMDQVEMKSLLDKIGDFKRDKKDLTEIAAIATFGQVAAFRSQLISLQAQRAFLDQKYGRNHPKMRQNELETKEAARQLSENVTMAISEMETRYNVSKQYETRLRTEMHDVDKLMQQLDKISVEYGFFERETASKLANYNRVVDRITEVSLANQMDNTSIKIFDPAFIPSLPTSGGPAEAGIKAGALGLALFLILPLGLGLMDTRIKTVAQIEGSLGQTLLGAVKRIRGLGEAERAHVFRLRKDDGLAEAYRGIYSEMDIRASVSFPKVLAITSTMPGDGKSLTATNLAAVFAAHGRRTLLIDCDLRRPTLHRYCGVDNRDGWTQWLDLPTEVSDRVLPSGVTLAENLDLLPAGGVARDPTETLNRLASSGLLKRLLGRYDLVILDTPPVAIFPDALLLCRHCQELVYVCKFASARVGLVRKTLERIQETGVNIVGLVLNQMPESRMKSYGYEGYGAYDGKYYRAYSGSNAPAAAGASASTNAAS